MKLNTQNIHLRVTAGLPKQFPSDSLPQAAFSGRSNVGKSSLINTLLSRKSFARVSSAPGKTITVNFYEVDKKMFLVDLPGYGYAKRTFEEKQKWSALVDGYFTRNPNIDRLRVIVQLIDSRVGPTADDRDMLRFMNEAGLPYIVAATKIDKLNATERAASLRALRDCPDIGKDIPIIPFSAKSGEGKAEIWAQLLDHCFPV